MHLVKPTDIAEKDREWIIDVRTPDEFEREHIPGSVNIPLPALVAAIPELKKQPRLILSCRSGNRAREAYEQLESKGCENLSCLEGGLAGWKQANLSTRSLKGGISVMRQVQIIVGSMVLVGYFRPDLSILVLIAGLGMLVAGLTDTCMMATVLGKMPWNRVSDSRACTVAGPGPVSVK